MMAMSLALVGAAAIFAWCLVTATMIRIDEKTCRGRSFWVLQIQNMLAQSTFQQFGGGK
jgi:hypothetical protein